MSFFCYPLEISVTSHKLRAAVYCEMSLVLIVGENIYLCISIVTKPIQSEGKHLHIERSLIYGAHYFVF